MIGFREHDNETLSHKNSKQFVEQQSNYKLSKKRTCTIEYVNE